MNSITFAFKKFTKSCHFCVFLFSLPPIAFPLTARHCTPELPFGGWRRSDRSRMGGTLANFDLLNACAVDLWRPSVKYPSRTPTLPHCSSPLHFRRCNACSAPFVLNAVKVDTSHIASAWLSILLTFRVFFQFLIVSASLEVQSLFSAGESVSYFDFKLSSRCVSQ